MTSSTTQHLSAPSTSSLRSHSVRSQRTTHPSPHVVTSPPWARDEPPSPLDDATDSVTTRNATEPRPSDDASYRSSYAAGHARPESRWWTFTLHRPRGSSSVDPADPPQLEKKPSSSKGRSKSWLISPTRERRFNENAYPLAGKPSFIGSPVLDDPMHWSRPPAKRNSITMAHTTTPGWDSPWTPRAPREGSEPDSYLDGPSLPGHDRDVDPTSWGKRKNRFRAFILSNPYVPLLFRCINVTFTTAALAVAIRIRIIEAKHSLMGVLGSSPTLVVIFAPLTLLHVMVAIYLEYFGRPLGLWRTSGKLAHTLSEVLFICAWSAALSLCFDNFFTSLVPCAPSATINWYNELPRPQSPLPDLHEDGVGDTICDGQLALICLVFLGLIMYCINLVISLFRIFEKVKYSIPSTGPV